MNRYKKKVVLQEEAKRYILPFDIPMRAKNLDEAMAKEARPLLDYEAVFGNRNPVEIEVGFGTGRFIMAYGRKYPAINILGLEITHKMVDHVANQVLEGGLANVRVVLCDGRLFMRHLVPADSVERVHVYFPDPWVKKRHIKRRIMNQLFFETAWRVLKPGGRLNLFTDHKDYFDYYLEQKQAFGRFEDDVEAGDYTPTSYEARWVKEGRTIYRAILRKPV